MDLLIIISEKKLVILETTEVGLDKTLKTSVPPRGFGNKGEAVEKKTKSYIPNCEVNKKPDQANTIQILKNTPDPEKKPQKSEKRAIHSTSSGQSKKLEWMFCSFATI